MQRMQQLQLMQLKFAQVFILLTSAKDVFRGLIHSMQHMQQNSQSHFGLISTAIKLDEKFCQTKLLILFDLILAGAWCNGVHECI